MRSISYILGGSPNCFDDCIDRSDKEKLLEVNVRLVVSEYTMSFHEEIVMQKELFAIFVWTFECNTFSYKDKLGGCLSMESIERQKRSIDNANYRLNILVNRVKDLDVNFSVTPEKFPYEGNLY